MPERDSIPAKLDYYLLIHDYAIPAWMAWSVLTVGLLAYTTLFDPLAWVVPYLEIGIVPALMFAWAWIWLVAGMMVGWVPPHRI